MVLGVGEGQLVPIEDELLADMVAQQILDGGGAALVYVEAPEYEDPPAFK